MIAKGVSSIGLKGKKQLFFNAFSLSGRIGYDLRYNLITYIRT